MACRWEPSLNPFPRLFDFFPVIYCFFFSGFLPVLRTMCRWKSSLDHFPILFDVFLIIFCCFLRVLPVLRTICKWTPSLHPFPILFVFFFWLFIVFFWRFLPVLRTICRWKPSLPPFPILLDFFLIIFFSGFLPVLKTMCRWKSSLHPFPILFVFFLIICCFFLRVLASFENNLQMKTLPASFPHTIWSFSDYFLSLDFVFIIFCFLGVFFCWFFILDQILVFWSLWSLRVHNASVFDTEVWKWYCFSQCGNNFARSWRPCEVKSASAGLWDRFWRAGIEHESLYAKQTRTA